MLDQIEAQSPTLYDRLHRAIDHSWTSSRLLVTAQILKSKEPHRFWLTLHYLWAGNLPRSIEKKFGKQSLQKLSPYKPGTWRDEAAGLIADVMQRGYKTSIRNYSKERAKAKANVKRSLTAYRKLSRLQRLTKKGRAKWTRYKIYEKAFLLAHHKKDRLEMLAPFLSEFHKK